MGAVFLVFLIPAFFFCCFFPETIVNTVYLTHMCRLSDSPAIREPLKKMKPILGETGCSFSRICTGKPETRGGQKPRRLTRESIETEREMLRERGWMHDELATLSSGLPQHPGN